MPVLTLQVCFNQASQRPESLHRFPEYFTWKENHDYPIILGQLDSLCAKSFMRVWVWIAMCVSLGNVPCFGVGPSSWKESTCCILHNRVSESQMSHKQPLLDKLTARGRTAWPCISTAGIRWWHTAQANKHTAQTGLVAHVEGNDLTDSELCIKKSLNFPLEVLCICNCSADGDLWTHRLSSTNTEPLNENSEKSSVLGLHASVGILFYQLALTLSWRAMAKSEGAVESSLLHVHQTISQNYLLPQKLKERATDGLLPFTGTTGIQVSWELAVINSSS